MTVEITFEGLAEEQRLKEEAIEAKKQAEIVEKRDKSVLLRCCLFDSAGVLCADAETSFFVYPEEIARKRLNFPGKEAFYYE